jgi:hypothetical protein
MTGRAGALAYLKNTSAPPELLIVIILLDQASKTELNTEAVLFPRRFEEPGLSVADLLTQIIKRSRNRREEPYHVK